MKKNVLKVWLLIFCGLFWGVGCQETAVTKGQDVSLKVDGERTVSESFYGDLEPEKDFAVDDLYDSEITASDEKGGPFVAEEGKESSESEQIARTGIRAQFIADGVKLTPLTDDGKSSAVAWAYHGDKIVFIRDMAGGTQRQLLIMNADGTEEKAVTPIGYPYFAEWSWKGD